MQQKIYPYLKPINSADCTNLKWYVWKFETKINYQTINGMKYDTKNGKFQLSFENHKRRESIIL